MVFRLYLRSTRQHTNRAITWKSAAARVDIADESPVFLLGRQ
jgi:hypothetical protein